MIEHRPGTDTPPDEESTFSRLMNTSVASPSRKLILIRGLPGSGKSTMAAKLVTQLRDDGKTAIYHEADMFFEAFGRYTFDARLLKYAHEGCLSATAGDLFHHPELTVIVSNTFTRLFEMRPYFELAALLGVPIEVLTAKGEYGSIHNVPEDAMQRMRDRWEEM